MVLFVGAHRPDRKPVFRLFRVFGFPDFPVFRAFGGSGLPGFRACGGSGSPGFRVCPGSRFHGSGSSAVPAAGCFGRFNSDAGSSPFYFGCRPDAVCRFRRGVSPASLPPGGVSGCRRCPRSGGAACASGACRRSSAPPLRARSPGLARAWRSTTARRRSP